ncbi:MAG: hypothetical protein M5R36_02700 [Deltaproteobacteria bacterium]|nr:hypothetical protein [Deltaproteobacteria bacterium]
MEQVFADVSNSPHNAFQTALTQHGWNAFFDHYDDPLLSRWMREDLKKIADMFRERGVRPIFVTYPHDWLGDLNDRLREAARDAGVPILEVEKPRYYYQRRHMFSENQFHLNGRGYRDLGKRVNKEFEKVFDAAEAAERIGAKSRISACRPRDFNGPTNHASAH